MPTSNPIDILLEHDKWATRQIIHAAMKLSPAQFTQKFDMGMGSLQANITHIISAMDTWTDTLARRPLRPRADQDPTRFSPDQLLQMLDATTAEFMALARARPLNDIVTRTREGKDYPFTRATVITHVTTHGMHHRAQCLNMLKQLGVKPLPHSSVAEWSRTVDFTS